TGLLEKEGAGLQPICEENNEQGAVDMGGVPEFLPGQIPFASPSARQRFSSEWHAALPDSADGRTGLTLPEMIEAANRGEIKALYVVGENPLGSLPASMKVQEALDKIDLIICQDPFMTETGEMADYLLPAATFAEKEGTFTNMAGEVNRVSEAFDPRGEARPDWKIFSELSKHLGQPLLYKGPEEIYQEIAKMVPGYFRGERPPVQIDPYLNQGFLSGVAGRYGIPSSEEAPTAGEGVPFFLSREQVIYHSGKLSTRDSGLMKIYDKPTLQIGTADAEALQLETGNLVKIKSPLGSMEVPVEVVPSLPMGLVQFPEHFNQPPVKDLLAGEVDTVSHVPYFKKGPVALEKIIDFNLEVIATNTSGAPPTSEKP
ncbi:MAG: molybdopterin oxidoreductase family protein, partial [Nitrospiria bacterium]